MGILTSKSMHKDACVLPRLGSGKFGVGCVEKIIVDSENSDDMGILATIYYPSDCTPTSDVRDF